MSFADYIRGQIADGQDIMVNNEYLRSITFVDICVLIHAMTTQNTKIHLPPIVARTLGIDAYTNSRRITVFGIENGEELAILMYLVDEYHLGSATPVDLFWAGNENGEFVCNPKYKMSNRFVLAAKDCGMYNHPIVKKIISNYDIDTQDYDPTEANIKFQEYMNQPKSARNI